MSESTHDESSPDGEAREPSPAGGAGDETFGGGSLGGRLRLLLLGSVLLGALSLLALGVVAAQRLVSATMERAVPASLEGAMARVVPDLGAKASPALEPGPMFDAVEPLAEGPGTPGLYWLTRAGQPSPGWVDPEGGRVAWVSTAYREQLLAPSLLPADARIQWAPEPTVAGAPSPPAGGWPETPTIYRNPAGELVFGGSRGVPGMRTRLVLEVPFSSVFSPVLGLLTSALLLSLVLTGLMALVSRRVTNAVVGPIHALSDAARQVSEGQLDVEVSPVPAERELALLTRTFNAMIGDLRDQRGDLQRANERLVQQNEALQAANEVLGQLSITDGLTKLHNHRFFQDFLTREIKRVARTQEQLSILVIDIDDFKRLNDQLGHAAGDELLTGLAEILNDNSRDADLVARYGGEEFVVLASNTSLEGAVLLAEKIRSAVAEASFILDDTMRLVKMTVSIGVNRYQGSRKAFFLGADEALYRAKAAGKNCVRVHEPPGEDETGPR